jgi:hypothetical protein
MMSLIVEDVVDTAERHVGEAIRVRWETTEADPDALNRASRDVGVIPAWNAWGGTLPP